MPTTEKISQRGGEDLYPTLEEKAAHLLYFIVKNHPFIDGNKRSGAFAFMLIFSSSTLLSAPFMISFMSLDVGPSLGRRAEISDAEYPGTGVSTIATAPISAEIWQAAETQRIKATLNTASGFEEDRMTADIQNGLLAEPAQEISPGIYRAESRLFIGEWFDPQLSGESGIVHGADFMFLMSKLVEQTTGSTIENVTEIRFNGVVKNEVDVFVSKRHATEDERKPLMTAKVKLKNGEDLYISAYDKGQEYPIKNRSASNTFVQHICVDPMIRHGARIKWDQKNDPIFVPPTNFEIELDALSTTQQAAFAKFYAKNPTGLTASTALDIVITGAQVLAYLGQKAGGIPEENALGAGFSNTTLPPVDKLLNGCKLRLTVLNDRIRQTAKAEFWPIQFEFIDSDTDKILGQGTFNWVNRLSQEK